MAKKIKSYNLDEDIVAYIDRLAAKMDRSASWALNHLLTQIALKDKLNKKQ